MSIISTATQKLARQLGEEIAKKEEQGMFPDLLTFVVGPRLDAETPKAKKTKM